MLATDSHLPRNTPDMHHSLRSSSSTASTSTGGSSSGGGAAWPARNHSTSTEAGPSSSSLRRRSSLDAPSNGTRRSSFGLSRRPTKETEGSSFSGPAGSTSTQPHQRGVAPSTSAGQSSSSGLVFGSEPTPPASSASEPRSHTAGEGDPRLGSSHPAPPSSDQQPPPPPDLQPAQTSTQSPKPPVTASIEQADGGDEAGPSDGATPRGSVSTELPSTAPPRLDLAKYPPQELVKLLASLLQQIASANDALRTSDGEGDETEDGASSTASGGRRQSAGGDDPQPDTSAQTDNHSKRTKTDTPSYPNAEGTADSRTREGDGTNRPPSTDPNATSTSTPSTATAPTPRPNPTSPSTPLFPVSSSHPTSQASPAFEAASPAASASSSLPSQPAAGASSIVTPAHPLLAASVSAFQSSSSSLCFHARNVPGISIEVYLLRILKYCPASNEVFLSLLVYFDRMSRLSLEVAGRTFAIDSFNVHRLVIAGVTVASKFFSDVFYTNSRYAKVGGLPQSELNQLELQFLLLNDFRLVIPLEEMQRYGDQLLLYSEGGAAAGGEAIERLVEGRRRKAEEEAEAKQDEADAGGGERMEVEAVARPVEVEDGLRESKDAVMQERRDGSPMDGVEASSSSS